MKYYFLLLTLISMVGKAEPLFDLHPTLVWVYEVSEKGKIYEVVNKIDAVKLIDGRSWYKLEEYGEIFWVSNSELGQIEAVNFYDYSNPTENDKPEVELIFKYPAKPKEQWQFSGDTNTYLGTATYEVPAGKFECHLYKIDMGQGDYSKSCIAIGVGVVYNESRFDGGSKSISKLVRYKK